MTPVTELETGIEIETATEIVRGTGIGTAIEIVTGTGAATATEAETAIETGTGPEIAHHAGTVETAARVGAVSSGTDPRTKSNGNASRAQVSDPRALRPAACPTLGRIQLRWMERIASKLWPSRSLRGLLLCGSPWLLATVGKGHFKICPDPTVRSPMIFSRLEEPPLTATYRIFLICMVRALLLSPRR